MTTKRELLNAVFGDRPLMKKILEQVIKEITMDDAKKDKRARAKTLKEQSNGKEK